MPSMKLTLKFFEMKKFCKFDFAGALNLGFCNCFAVGCRGDSL